MNSQRVQFFDPTGTFLGTWGNPGSEAGQFSWPLGVAMAPDGTVYVADGLNNRIQFFDAAGTYLGQWGNQGNSDGQFAEPFGVAVAPDGTVYVVDASENRIQAFCVTPLAASDQQRATPGIGAPVATPVATPVA